VRSQTFGVSGSSHSRNQRGGVTEDWGLVTVPVFHATNAIQESAEVVSPFMYLIIKTAENGLSVDGT
jgi:hypothetical protein